MILKEINPLLRLQDVSLVHPEQHLRLEHDLGCVWVFRHAGFEWICQVPRTS